MDYKRSDYDDRIRADELCLDDEVHLTFMGGDEYVSIRNIGWDETGQRIKIVLFSWGGDFSDELKPDDLLWIKKRNQNDQ